HDVLWRPNRGETQSLSSRSGRPHQLGIDCWPDPDREISDLHSVLRCGYDRRYIRGEFGKLVSFGSSSSTCPVLNDLLNFPKAIGQSRRTWLQDQRRFDLVHVLVLHCRNSTEAGTRHHPLGPELLAAPRADDQIRLTPDHLIEGHHAILGGGL